MAKLPAAIVLGIDTPIGLTVVRELGSRGVPVHGIGSKEYAIGRYSRWLSSFSVRPKSVAVSDWLPDIIRKYQASAVLAIGEKDLLALSALPPVLEGCRILTPRRDALDIVLSKSRTMEIAARLGIDTPASWQPEADQNFAGMANRLTFPVVLKWANPPALADSLSKAGIALQKSEYADTAGQLLDVLARYAPVKAWPLVQQYCAGAGFGQMLHMAGGKATLRFQHQRLHEWPPEGGVSTYCKSLPLDQHQEQMRKSEALLAAIGWEGPAMIEYRYDAKAGRYWLMEINGRFWGSLPLAWHCGAHFAWEQYRHAVLGGKQTPPPRIKMRRVRFMVPESRRLASILLARRKIMDRTFQTTPVRDLLGFFASFLDPRMRYYVFTFSDPLPFFADMATIIRRLLRREKSL